MVNRTKRDRKTDATFSAIGYELGDIRTSLSTMDGMMNGMMSPSIIIPEPAIPFKIAERTDIDGSFFITVVVNIPTDQPCEEIRIILIRKSRNAVLATDADTDAAKARAQREAKATTFRVQVDEDQYAAGVVEAEIGPLKPKKNDTDNAYQLIRLVTVSDAGAVGKNPEANPFSGSTFPYPALRVRSDGGSTENNKFFEVGDGVGTISKPSAARIITNEVNLGTQAADARVAVKIFASEDETKTFEEQGINEVIAVFRRYADGTDETVDAGKRNITIPVEIEDPSAKFVFAVRDFDLADRFRWVKNRGKSNFSPKPVVASPASEVSFYAGGTLPTANIPELATAPVFTFTTITPDSAELKLTLTQPTPAVLLKRLVFEKQRSDGTWRKVEAPTVLLQEEKALSPGTVTEFTTEVQVKKNQSAINFRAKLVGVNHTEAVPIERIVTVAGVNTITPPQTPVDGDIESVPDDTTNVADAKTNITVRTQGGVTFASLGVDHIGCIIRKAKASGGGSMDDVDDATDSKLRTYSRPLDESELTLTSATINVPGLRFDVRYVLKKTLFEASGTVIKSAAANIAFIAGNKSAIGLSALALFTPTRVRIDERHSDITCRYDQPAAGQAAYVAAMTLFRKRPGDADFTKVEPAADLKSNPDYSSNTSGTTPNTATQKYVTFNVQHKKNVGDGTAPNSLQYKYRLRDGNGNMVDSPTFVDTNTGTGGPTDLPSVPAAADIVVNAPSEDITARQAQVVFRLYADWTKTKTFAQVGADRAEVKIVDFNTAAGSEGRVKTFPAQITDTSATFIDIEGLLTLGRWYKYRKNITFRDGVAAESQASEVMFYAGVSVDNFNAVTMSIALSPQDERSTQVAVTVNQPTPFALLKRLRVGRQLPPPPPDRSWSTALKYSPAEVLLEDKDLFVNGASRIYDFSVNHPRGVTGILYRAELIGLNGLTKAAETTGNSGDEDTGTPQWVGRVPNPKTKWKGDSTSGTLRFKYNLPDRNLNAHVTTKVTVVFVTNGNTYYWNPNDDNPRSGSAYLKNITPSFNDPIYYIDAGPTAIINFAVDRPSASAQGDLPLEIYNDLLAASGTLTITAYVFNRLTVDAATAGVTSDDISWVF